MIDDGWDERVRARLTDAWGRVAAVEERRGQVDRSDAAAVAEYARLADIDLRLADAWTRMAQAEAQSRAAAALSELADTARDGQYEAKPQTVPAPRGRWGWRR